MTGDSAALALDVAAHDAQVPGQLIIRLTYGAPQFSVAVSGLLPDGGTLRERVALSQFPALLWAIWTEWALRQAEAAGDAGAVAMIGESAKRYGATTGADIGAENKELRAEVNRLAGLVAAEYIRGREHERAARADVAPKVDALSGKGSARAPHAARKGSARDKRKG